MSKLNKLFLYTAFFVVCIFCLNDITQISADTHGTTELATSVDGHHHDGEHKEGGLPQLDASKFTPQIFWLFVTFGMLFLLVRFFITPRMQGYLDRRQNFIDQNNQKASNMLQEAENMKKEAEIVIAQAREEGRAMVSEQSQKLEDKKRAMMAEIDQKIHDRIQDAEKAIEQKKKDLAKQRESDVREIAQLVLKKAGFEQ